MTSNYNTPQKGMGAPEQSHKWLRLLLPKRLQPWLRGFRKQWQLRSLKLDEPYRTVFPYCQASKTRQENLVRMARLVEQNGIEGAIVECGVLDGGTAALMAYASRQSARPLHLFDAWRGLPASTEEDGEAGKKWVGEVVGSSARVLEVMSKLSISKDRLHLHRGWFADTFPVVTIEKIALLHIDCDFYEPTVLCLNRWYPHVSSGGFIQFDDYLMFQGCTKAVDEFLERNPNIRPQTSGDPSKGGAFFIQKP